MINAASKAPNPTPALNDPVQSDRRDKLAYRLARQIAADIIRDGWVEGRPLGQEKALLEYYQVSRDPFREALRILEWQGIVRSVRGPHGGLRVAAPAAEAVINILRDYLELTDISFTEVLEASRVTTSLALKLASARLSAADTAHLQQLLDQSRQPAHSRPHALSRLFDLFTAFGDLSGNLALSVFMGPLNYILIDSSHVPEASDADFTRGSRLAWGRLRQVVDALISGDDGQTQIQLQAYFDLVDVEMNPALRQPAPEIRYANPLWRENSDNKGALSLVYRIRHDIRLQQLQPGDRLGQEPQLLEHYQVSRSIFREAIRMLELIGIAEFRLGRDGGLVVAQPNPEYTQSTAALFLGYANYNLATLNEVHSCLESWVARRAAEVISPAQAEELAATIAAEAKAAPEQLFHEMIRVHRLLARIAGNRIFALYIEVMLIVNNVNPARRPSAELAASYADELRHSHQQLAAAIIDRQPSLASRKMIDHFKLLARIVA